MSFLTFVSGAGCLYSYFHHGLRQPSFRQGVMKTVEKEPYLATMFVVCCLYDTITLATFAKVQRERISPAPNQNENE